jgi:hypothetical protein
MIDMLEYQYYHMNTIQDDLTKLGFPDMDAVPMIFEMISMDENGYTDVIAHFEFSSSVKEDKIIKELNSNNKFKNILSSVAPSGYDWPFANDFQDIEKLFWKIKTYILEQKFSSLPIVEIEIRTQEGHVFAKSSFPRR